MSGGARNRPPLSPGEVWISGGRQVLYVRPTLRDRWSQRLEITSGELRRISWIQLQRHGPRQRRSTWEQEPFSPEHCPHR